MAETVGTAYVEIRPDVDRFAAELRSKLAGLTKGLDKEGSRGGQRFGSGFSSGLSRGLRPSHRQIRTLGIAFAGLAGAAVFGPLVAGLSGVAAAATALSGSLLQASASAAALPGLLAAGGLGAAALITGFRGVGGALDALNKSQQELAETGEVSAETQEALAQAMGNLTPAAREAVSAFDAVGDAFSKIRRDVQETLFSGIADDIQNVGETIAGVLGPALETAAGSLNSFFSEFAEFITAEATVDRMTTVTEGLNRVFERMLDAVEPLTSAVLDLFIAAMPLTERFADALADASERFAEFTQRASESGDLQAVFDNAGDRAAEFGSILGNIGEALKNTFSAGLESGDNLLAKLDDLTGRWADWTATVEGENALEAWFDRGERVITEVGKLIGELGSSLSQLSQEGGTQAFIDISQAVRGDLLPALTEMFLKLQDTGSIETLVGAFSDIARAIGDLGGGALKGFADTLAVVAGVFSAIASNPITGFLLRLSAVFFGVSVVIKPLIGILVRVVGVFVRWFPILARVATFLGGPLSIAIRLIITGIILLIQNWETVGPVITTALNAIVAAAKFVGGAFVAFGQIFVDAWNATSEATRTAIEAIVGFFTGLVSTLVGWGQSIWDAITSPFIRLFNFLIGNSLIPDLINGIVGWFIRLPGLILGAISGLVGAIGSFFAGVASTAISIVSSIVTGVVSFFAQLPGRVIGAISSLLGMIRSFFSSILSTATRIASNIVSGVANFFAQLPGRVIGVISSLLGMIGSFFSGIFSTALDWASRIVSGVSDFFANLPGNVINAVSGLVGMIGDFFANVFSTAGSFISAGIETILGFFRGLPDLIIGAIGDLGGIVGGFIGDAIGSIPIIGGLFGAEVPSGGGVGVFPTPLPGPTRVGAFGNAAGVDTLAPLARQSDRLAINQLRASAGQGRAQKVINVELNVYPQQSDPEAVAESVLNRLTVLTR